MSKANGVRDSGFNEGSFNPIADQIAEAIQEEAEAENTGDGQGQQPLQIQPQQPQPQQLQPQQQQQPQIQVQVQNEMAPPSVQLESYSGLARGATFPGAQGQRQEHFEVRDWCRRVETIGASCGWSSQQKASHAVLALVPGSPADNWHRVATEKTAYADWEAFKADLIDRFAPPITATERVKTIRSMKQNRGERVSDFKNRLQIQFESLTKGAKKATAQKYADVDTTEALKKDRAETVEVAMSYVMQCLFLAGLEDRFVVDITKATNAETLEEMEKIAIRTELATGPAPGRINMVQEEEGATGGAEKPITRSELQQMIAAMSHGNKPNKNDQKKGQTSGSKVWCYYCLKQGHISRFCKALKADRKDEIFRPTVQCQPMTKQEYQALTPEEKMKGKHMVGKAKEESRTETSTVSTVRVDELPRATAYQPNMDAWLGYSMGN